MNVSDVKEMQCLETTAQLFILIPSDVLNFPDLAAEVIRSFFCTRIATHIFFVAFEKDLRAPCSERFYYPQMSPRVGIYFVPRYLCWCSVPFYFDRVMYANGEHSLFFRASLALA